MAGGAATTRRRVGSRREPSQAGERGRRGRRYAVVYDIEGPRVRLGVVWFVVAALAIGIGPLPTALVYGGAAAIAAAQTARSWRKRRNRPDEVVAALIAGLMGGGACFGAGGAGIGLLIGTVLAVMRSTSDTKSRNPTVVDAGWTIQCALPPGVLAMSMVLLAPGSTKARRWRCCCSCRRTRSATSSWAPEHGTRTRGPRREPRRSWWSPSSCRPLRCRASTSARPGSSGAWSCCSPRWASSSRRRLLPVGAVASIRASPARLAAARRSRVVLRDRPALTTRVVWRAGPPLGAVGRVRPRRGSRPRTPSSRGGRGRRSGSRRRGCGSRRSRRAPTRRW